MLGSHWLVSHACHLAVLRAAEEQSRNRHSESTNACWPRLSERAQQLSGGAETSELSCSSRTASSVHTTPAVGSSASTPPPAAPCDTGSSSVSQCGPSPKGRQCVGVQRCTESVPLSAANRTTDRLIQYTHTLPRPLSSTTPLRSLHFLAPTDQRSLKAQRLSSPGSPATSTARSLEACALCRRGRRVLNRLLPHLRTGRTALIGQSRHTVRTRAAAAQANGNARCGWHERSLM